jgi:VWFA-related protein
MDCYRDDHSMNQRLLLALGLFFLAAASIFGQTPRSGTAIEVTLVEVPVNVYDRAGNAIRELTAADFELTDEGKKREITHFEEIDLAKLIAAKQTPSPAARRNFMLLFDLSNSTPVSLGRSRAAALEFVKNDLTPVDVGAVATFSVDGGFRLLTNFTGDRNALAAAIMTLGNPKLFHTNDPLLLAATAPASMMTGPAIERGGTKLNADEYESIQSRHDAEIAPFIDAANRASKMADEEYRRGRVSNQIKAFTNLAKLLNSVSGRKELILLSEGFDPKLVQGREAPGTQPEIVQENDKIMSGLSREVNTDERYGNTTALTALEKMGELLRRSDVVMHAIDIKGLRVNSDAASGNQRVSNEGLYLMTRPSGGEVFKNANDLSANFNALLKQQEVVYVLGFEAPGETPGKFHSLKVDVKAPGAKASFRSGYYEPNATPSAMETTLSAGEILLNDVPMDAVKTNVIAAPFPVKGQNAQVPVIVEIDGPSLLAGANGLNVNGDLFIYAFDRDNHVKDSLFQRISLDLMKVGPALQMRGLKYYGTLSLPPGDYVIKTLVHVPSSSLDGFKRVELTVPDFSQPTVLSPIATEQPGEWLMVRGTARPERAYDYPFTVAQESFIPAGTWQIAGALPQHLALFVYNADPKDLVVSGKLKMADGSTRDVHFDVVKVTAPDASKASQVLLDLKADGLAAGRYALDFSVRTKSGGWSKAFTIPVVVQ